MAFQVRKLFQKYFVYMIAYQVIMLTLLFLLVRSGAVEGSPNLTRRWGGYNSRPMTDECYGQERTAILLSLFLGSFGVDQFYAHHWVLAVFKLLTLGGLGTWSLVDHILWIVGGVYATPGCPGGHGGL